MNSERDFISDVLANPAEAERRLAFADWLSQQGDLRADLIRIQHTLRFRDVVNRKNVEAEMQALLRSGLQPVTFSDQNSIGMKLALLPAGEFLMGAPDSDKHAEYDERPQHSVTISRPFFCGIYPVTQEQYAQISATSPQTPGVPLHPASGLSWFDAVHFCNLLSEREGFPKCYTITGEDVAFVPERGYRLPSEAEWEYACRAGTTTTYFFGDDTDMLTDYVVCDTQPTILKYLGLLSWIFMGLWPSFGYRKVDQQPSGTKLPNPWGLYDMLGNELEWCQDYHELYWYSSCKSQGTVVDPIGPPEGIERVIRGGSYLLGPAEVRAAYRLPAEPDVQFCSFRVVRWA